MPYRQKKAPKVKKISSSIAKKKVDVFFISSPLAMHKMFGTSTKLLQKKPFVNSYIYKKFILSLFPSFPFQALLQVFENILHFLIIRHHLGDDPPELRPMVHFNSMC